MNIRSVARGSTRRAWGVFGMTMGVALLALLCNTFGIGEQLVAQTVLLLAFVAGAYILVRYVTAVYVYEIITEDAPIEESEEDGEETKESLPEKQTFLYIIKMQGKRAMTVAKLATDELTAITSQKPENAKTPVLNFSPAIFPEDDTFLAFGRGREFSLLRIHADKPLLDALHATAPDAAEHITLPEEQKKKSRSLYDISDELPKENDSDDEQP